MFGSQLRLDPSPHLSVPRDNDRALYRNAIPRQILVVLDRTIVHIDKRRSDITIRRVGVITRQLLVFLITRRIHSDRRFFKLGMKAAHLQKSVFWSRKEHLEGLNMGVPAPFLVLR